VNPLQEATFQVAEPIDFDSLADILRDVSAADACRVLPGVPYSIATNLRHAAIWQAQWLTFCRGEAKLPPVGDDWPQVDPSQWDAVRDEFLAGLREAVVLSNQSNLHPDIQRRLLKLAIHGAYHIGQIQLLVRMLADAPNGVV
jgi:hypothetical protein